MNAILFVVVTLAAASGLVGAWRTLTEAMAGRWFDYGDGAMLWMAWAADPGRQRLLKAGIVALIVVALALLARKKGISLLKPFDLVVRLVGRPIFAILAVVFALLPQIVAPMVRPDTTDKPSILFILLDTVRLDYVGWGGSELDTTPKLDKLAAQGAAFTQAISQASWTKPSVASMITGLIPSKHLAVGRPRFQYYEDLEASQRTLADAFAAAGYRTAAISTNPNIRPDYGFDQGFHIFRGSADDDADAVIAEAKSVLDNTTGPYFMYLHFNDAHYPYSPKPEFAKRFDKTNSDAQLTGPMEHEFRNGDRIYTAEDVEHLRLAYAEEIAYLDDRVGAFVQERLAEDENLFVVLVSDHGEEFMEHGDLGHGHTLYEELLRVPLQFSWSPGIQVGPLKSNTISEQVLLVDIAATLLDVAGLEWPEAAIPLDGLSLLPVLQGKNADDVLGRPAFAETEAFGSPLSGYTGPLRTWRTPAEKLIMTDPFGRTAGRFWLFNLEEDPKETENLAAAAGKRVRELHQLLQRSGWLIKKEKELPMPGEGGATNELSEAMQQLGYADTDTPETIDESEIEFAPGTVPWIRAEDLQ